MAPTLADAVSRFGKDVKAALNDPAASGEPEEQLRTPLVNLIAALNTLIGSALRLFTEETNEEHPLYTALRTLTRVLGTVDWHAISKDDPVLCSNLTQKG